jgi:hypothetical protein
LSHGCPERRKRGRRETRVAKGRTKGRKEGRKKKEEEEVMRSF